MDNSGNLYGVTVNGGAYNQGTVFELSPPAPGQTTWTPTVIFTFDGGVDGSAPNGGLVEDKAGNIYGTTNDGGASGFGTVFELTPPNVSATSWSQTVLYSFNGTNGAAPLGGLIADAAGNLYGTTIDGGAAGGGTVFKLAPPKSGQTAWMQSVLVSFNGTNGWNPYGNLLLDVSGNLYGTTSLGDQNSGCASFAYTSCGTVFKLTPPATRRAPWKLITRTGFNGTDGISPTAGVVFDTAGNLYGTTPYGGLLPGDVSGYGTVFKIKP
jgi:uncharacterized repeat protein (TIGR03803 family)